MVMLKDWVYYILYYSVYGYQLLLIAYIILGWIVPDRHASWYVFLSELAEPPLRFVRKITQGRLVVGMLDLSPILLFFGLYLIQALLVMIFRPGA